MSASKASQAKRPVLRRFSSFRDPFSTRFGPPSTPSPVMALLKIVYGSWIAVKFDDVDEKAIGIQFGDSASQQVAEALAVLCHLAIDLAQKTSDFGGQV